MLLYFQAINLYLLVEELNVILDLAMLSDLFERLPLLCEVRSGASPVTLLRWLRPFHMANVFRNRYSIRA